MKPLIVALLYSVPAVMIRTITCALAAALLATPANALERKLTCTGVLEVRNDDDLRLKPDPGSARWCDASFDGWKYQAANSEVARHVRTGCAEGIEVPNRRHGDRSLLG
jgi:hypothetical protein